MQRFADRYACDFWFASTIQQEISSLFRSSGPEIAKNMGMDG